MGYIVFWFVGLGTSIEDSVDFEFVREVEKILSFLGVIIRVYIIRRIYN